MINFFRKLKSWIFFLGSKTVYILIASFFLAVLLFFIEFCFAYAVQSFLGVLGLLNQNVIRGPLPLVNLQPETVFSLLLALVLIRGFVLANINFFRGMAEDGFRKDFRLRISNWAFNLEEPLSSDVLHQFTEVANVASSAVMCLQILLANGVAILLVGIYLTFKAPMLLGLLLLGGVFLLPFLQYVDRSIRDDGGEIEIKWKDISDSLLRGLGNRRLLRIHGMLDSLIDSISAKLEKQYHLMMHFHFFASIKLIVPQTLGVAMVFTIAYIASQNMQLDAGTMVVAFYLLLRIVQMLAQSTNSSSRLLLYWPQLVSLHEWWCKLENVNSIEKISMNTPLPRGPLGFEFYDVHFYHNEDARGILHISALTIMPGNVVVITGASGSGKSTIINLMLGLVMVKQGCVEILGKDGSKTPLLNARDTLLSRTAYAEAENYLFPGTLMDNLCSGLKKIPSNDEIDAVLKLAEVDFLGSDGLDYQLADNGSGISMGQRQRIGLARAFLRKPDLLILDEATSNLDSPTEKKILASLKAMPNKPTIVFVSHRNNASEFADLVLDVKDGLVNQIKIQNGKGIICV